LKFKKKENSNIWELKKIDGRDVSSKTNIKFEIHIGKSIELHMLYPFYPKISGITVLQFMSALAYTCDLDIQLQDASDLTTPYLNLFGQTYYEYTLLGRSEKEMSATQNAPINKTTFLECVTKHSDEDHWMYGNVFLGTLETCYTERIDVEDCPIHYNFLGHLLYKTIMPLCVDIVKKVTNQASTFKIEKENLKQIMEKIPPREKKIAHQYPKIRKCISTIKEYQTIVAELRSKSTYKEVYKTAFEFCFSQLENTPTALNVFQMMRGCVFQTLDFLWKNKCTTNN